VVSRDSIMKWVVPVLANRAEKLLALLPSIGGWRISSLGGGAYEVTYSGYRLRMNRDYALNTFNEDGILKGLYLPRHSIEGKVVLDVGAGCGETAALFLAAGARSVVCVEPNREAFFLLLENIKKVA